MGDNGRVITAEQLHQAGLIWDYHRMKHEPRPVDVAIALGTNDLRVADHAAELYHAGLFPALLFTGGNSPSTAARFPRGEAVHFRERALLLGVPNAAILLETEASNTGENIAFSRRTLTAAGLTPRTVLLVTKPYMERRAYATARKQWPEVEPVPTSERVGFEEYLTNFGEDKLVIDMIVGDLQRLIIYPERGFAVEQHVPEDVRDAYKSLVEAGFDGHLSKP